VADGRTTWRRQIDALSDEFAVVAWDAQRLRQALELADLSPEAFAETLLPTMFSETT
jgi:hypothetical protein